MTANAPPIPLTPDRIIATLQRELREQWDAIARLERERDVALGQVARDGALRTAQDQQTIAALQREVARLTAHLEAEQHRACRLRKQLDRQRGYTGDRGPRRTHNPNRTPTGEALHLGPGLWLVPAPWRLESGTVRLNLTATETIILQALAKTPGQAVRYAALFRVLFGSTRHTAQDMNTLRAHLARLRRKLATADLPLRVLTAWDRGLMLEVVEE